MSLVQLRGVHRYYGAHHVLGPVDLEIHQHDRIGLIGPNGSGKSSLLDIIAGAEPEEGVVSRAKGLRIGYLRQETPIRSDLTLYQYALEAFRHLDEIEESLRSLEARMADPRVQSDPDALESTVGTYQRLLTQLQEGGGLEKEARAKGVLFGLGFREEDLAKPLNELSGGQRARAQLARTLLSQPDLLLLDEPTNHLDLEAVEWLQGFLSRFPKSLVLVSHDRYLLRAVVEKIWEIEGTNVLVFRGGYDASREQAAQRREQMAKRYEAAQQERARLEAFIRKYKAGSRATQAKSREKRLQRMEDVPPPPEEARRAKFTVPLRHRSERRVCTLEGVSLGYQGRVVLKDLDLEITRGQRIGIAGPNGSGKSTLLAALAGALSPLEGRIDWGRGVVPAYYSQLRTDLDETQSVLEIILDASGQLVEEARSFLARFLFRGDDVFKKAGDLSGGEKSRLALARLLVRGGNFLLLDEPTNHLDIDMQEALEEALEAYEGTLIFVTHDRRLLDSLAQIIWWIEDGTLHVIDGGYEALSLWLAARRNAAAAETDELTAERRPGSARFGGRQEERPGAKDRAQDRERERRLRELEAEVEGLAARKAWLEDALADPETYQDPQKAAEIAREHAEVAKALEAREALWLKLAEGLVD